MNLLHRGKNSNDAASLDELELLLDRDDEPGRSPGRKQRTDQLAPGGSLESVLSPRLAARFERTLAAEDGKSRGQGTLSSNVGPGLFEAALASGKREQILGQVVARRGSGRALPRELAGRLEQQLGVALGDVRVHDDLQAQAAVRALGVAAFTFGRDIFLGSTHASEILLAHEAAHAAQHRGATPDHASLAADGAEIAIDEDEGHEDWADRVAASLYTTAGARMSVPVAAPAVRFKGDVDPVAIIAKEMGSDEGKAKDMLAKASGEGRASVEAAIRKNFDAKKADELIKNTPAGGGTKTPEVKGKDEAGKEKPKGDAKGKGDGKGDAKGKGDGKDGKPGGGATGGPGGGGGPPGESGDPQNVGDLGMAAGDLDLIHAELIEHQRWGAAKANVGDAGSVERAGFIADQAGKGAISGGLTGFAMGVVGGVVGKLAQRFLTKVPGIGAIIAGGFSAYALFTKDWGESAETIGKFGQGNSTYEVLANSIASVSEILDIAVNVLNVLAGIIGIISALMWLITIITLGAASPLAATLSSIALGIIAVTSVIDDLNKMCLQPLVLLFRALHTFTTDADPREVEAQGEGIAKASSEAWAALGAKAGGKLGEAGTGKIVGDGPKIDPAAGGAGGKDPAAADPNAQPHAQDPNAGGQAPHDPNAPHPADPNGGGQAPHDPNAQPAGPPKDPAAAKAEADAKKAEWKKKPWKEKIKDGIQEAKKQIQKNQAEVAEAKKRADAAEKTKKDLEKTKKAEVEKARDEARKAKTKEIEDAAEARKKQIDAERDAKLAEIDQKGKDGRPAAEEGAKIKRDADVDAAGKQRLADIEAAANRMKAAQDAAFDAEVKSMESAKADYDAAVKDRMAEVDALDKKFDADRSAADKIPDPEKSQALINELHSRWQAERKAALAQADAKLKAAEAQRQAQWDAAKKQRNAEIDAAKQSQDAEVAAAQKRGDQAIKDAFDAEQKAMTEYDKSVSDAAGAEKDKANDAKKGATDDAAKQKAKDVDPAGTDAAKQKAKDVDEQIKKQEEAKKQAEKDQAKDDPQKGEGHIKEWTEDFFKKLTGQDTEKDGAKKKAAQEAKFAPDVQNPKGQPTAHDMKIVKTERIDPKYKDPPAETLPHLQGIRQQIEADLAAAAQAEQLRIKMQMEEAKAKNDQQQLQQLQAQSQSANSAVNLHKAAVARKDQAVAEQKARQEKSEGSFESWAQRQAGFATLLSTLGYFNTFTWIGAKLGSSSFQKMNDDGNKFAEQLVKARGMMDKENAKNPANKIKILDDDAKVKATDTKATTSAEDTKKSDEKLKDLSGKNTETATNAGAAKNEAAGDQAAKTQEAEAKKAQYKQMAGALKGWAVEHRAARMDAKAQQEARAASPESFGSDLKPAAPAPAAPAQQAPATQPTDESEGDESQDEEADTDTGTGDTGTGDTGGGNNDAGTGE